MNLFSLGGFFSDIWMSIWLSLNDFVYSIISVLYQVFEGVANVNLFSEEVFKDITSRIYIIMGIAMLFIFAYNLILMIINPEEKKSTGQTTKIVKETIISLVLVILLPTIFNYMSIFQKHILESQIISQIILGDSGGTNAEECDFSEYTIYNEYNIGNVEDTSFLNWKSWASLGIYQIYLSTKDSTPTTMLTESCEYYSEELTPSQRGAYALPTTIFQAFYHPTRVDYNSCEEWIETCKDDKSCDAAGITEDEDKEMCAYYVYDVKLAKYMGNIAPFNSESKFYSKVKADDGTFEFNGLMALAAGVLGLYMFVCYTIAIGTRVAKLGFLQLISPIAVMMRIIPKQKEAMFDKWLKHLINTYLDVFIRLMIIYFSLFAISLVPDVIDALFESIEGSWYVAALSAVVVILGILMFAQKAPDLFKEFFGNSGNFALKSPSKQLGENKYAMGALGAIGGAASGAVKNFGKGNVFGGFGSGLVRGARAGYKSQNFRDLKYNTSSAVDRVLQARDERDIRQEYDKKNGWGAYRAKALKNSFERWTSGDSFASLTAKSNDVKKMQQAYDSILKLVEGKIDELPDAFSFGGRSYGYYKREADSAVAAHENFDSSRYAQEYKKTHSVSDSAAQIAAEREKDRLNLAAGVAQENARLVREAIADAVIAERGGGPNGISSKPIKIEGMQTVSLDSEGIATIEKTIKDGMVSTAKEVKGVGDKIEEANSLFEKNSVMLSENARNDIESHRDEIRKNNGILKGELGHISSELAKLSELKKSDK